MGLLSNLTLLLLHPNEFRTLLQFWLWHTSKRDITAPSHVEETGWNRPSMRRCWELLDATSRSFSSVIKELDGDLARIITIFYLVLRGLDTVEDDMTIPDSVKQPLLRSFHEKIVTPGWTFNESGPLEKDRELLVEFHQVVAEIQSIPSKYSSVIIDICHEMEVGMADYCHKAIVDGEIGLDTLTDYDLYCHYVAGLVGEGLCRILSASGKEAEWLGDQKNLANAMGLFLQKTNITRDFKEDVDSKRLFWPKAIYNSHGFKNPSDMSLPENAERAVHALNEMILDAMRHATDCLDYLTLIKNQSVFNFCAIPQTMAIATLAVCFGNKEVFQRNVKIRKAEAARLIMQSKNPRDVALIFRKYSQQIHQKVKPTDPNYLSICLVCSRIDQWTEFHYPSFIQPHPGASETGGITQFLDPNDVRSKVFELEAKRAEKKALEKKANGYLNEKGIGNGIIGGSTEADGDSTSTIMLFVGGFIGSIVVLSLGVVWALMKIYPD